MAAHTPAYRLLPLRLSAAQTSMDGLVSALWCSIGPTEPLGPSWNLDRIFARMHERPDLAALQLCPYYFDQVTYSLPPSSSWTSSHLTLQHLPCRPGFQTARHRHQPGSYRDTRPDSGIDLSRLCQLQDLHTGGSITTRVFLHLMYGHNDLLVS